MKRSSVNPFLIRQFLAAACITSATQAADQTWKTTGFTDGNWATAGNWVGGALPGGATGVASGDTATFNGANNLSVTPDATRNIKNITFDTASAGAFVISGGGLVLTNAGAITINAAVTNTQTINTNLLLSTTASATYSFINNSSTSAAKLNIGGNVTGQATATNEVLTLGGTNGGTVSGVIGNGTAGGTVGVTKSGTGTWTLTGANTYTGTTTLSAGTLALSGGNNRLATTGAVNFTGASTLDIGSTSQTLANLTVANNITGTVIGSAGSLTLSGYAFNLGSASNNTTQTLNMSGLGLFTYNSATTAFTVSGLNSTTSSANDTKGVLTLASKSTITASAFYIGHFPASSLGTGADVGIVNLGQSNTINADSIGIGDGSHNDGTLKFQALTSPSLTIRGTAGGSSRSNLVVGQNNSGSGYLGTVDLTIGVTTGSTLDAMIGTLLIGNNNRGASSGNKLDASGAFTMGGGILDATSITVAADVAGTSTTSGACTTTGTFTVGVTGGAAGGTVKVETLTIGNKLSSGNNSLTGTVNLNNGAILAAKTIQAGSFGGGTAVTRTFTWNDGTIKNYDASNNLTINSGLTTFNLAGAGLHAFDISSGRTGTVNQIMSGASGALTKLGSGTLVLTVANTYGGNTILNNGTTQLDFSAAGAPASNIISTSSALALGGGTLELKGKSATVNTQTFAGLGGTGGTLELTQNSATSINATLGAITGNGSINFAGANTTVSGGVATAGSLNYITSTTAGSNDGATRLGAHLWNGTDWASTAANSGATATYVVLWQGTYNALTTDGNSSNSTGDLRIQNGTGTGTAATYTADTAINSLLMSATTYDSTMVIGSFTLTVGSGAGATGAVAITTTGQSLTIGASANQGVLTAGASGASTLDLNNQNTASTLTVNSAIADNAGSGAVSLDTIGAVVFNGTNTYTGSTTINGGGTLQIGGGGSLGSGTYAGNVANLGIMRYSSSTNQILSGVISGAGGALIKDTGSSTLTLSGTNTYNGTTTVNGGILLVNGNQSAATGAVIVSNTGTRLMGTGTVGGATTINAGAIHSAGSTTGAVGNQSFSSDLTYANGSIFEWDINANSTASGFDTVAVTGNLNGSTGGDTSVFRVVFGTTAKAGIEDSGNAFWNTPFTTQVWNMTSLFGKNFTSGQFTSVQTYDTSGSYNVSSMGSFTISGTSLTWTAVPEPSSALAGLLLGAGLLRRRRGVR